MYMIISVYLLCIDGNKSLLITYRTYLFFLLTHTHSSCIQFMGYVIALAYWIHSISPSCASLSGTVWKIQPTILSKLTFPIDKESLDPNCTDFKHENPTTDRARQSDEHGWYKRLVVDRYMKSSYPRYSPLLPHGHYTHDRSTVPVWLVRCLSRC